MKKFDQAALIVESKCLSYTLRLPSYRERQEKQNQQKPKRKQHVNMWKLKSPMRSDASTRTFFLNSAWGESRLFQAGCESIAAINATPSSHKTSIADIIRPSSVCLPAWHIAKESIQLFHMQASIRPCKRKYPAVAHASIHPVHCKRKYPAVATGEDPSSIDCSCQYQAKTSPEASRTSGSGFTGTVEAADGAAVEWAAGVTGAAAGCGNRD